MSRRGAVLAASLVLFLGLGLSLPSPAGATQVKIFQLQSQKAFLKGTLEGVSIDSEGRLELADRAERVTSLGEPFLFSAAAHPDGWVVGTGNDGKVLLVHRDGKVDELLAAPEGQVFAVWADPDGTVFAGVSPGGKVYRIPAGAKDLAPEKALWFETGETYVWALARAADGSLLVGTGTSGKLFRVTGKGEGSVLYDSDDTHVRSLAVLPGGDILVGTAGDGLILRVSADGSKARTLYDADQPEVVAFAPKGDGSFYAAVIASEASPVDLAAAAAASASGAKKSAKAASGGAPTEPGAQGTPTVTVHVGPAAAGSRPAGFSGKHSQVVSISPEGVVEPVWSFDDETVFDLLWNHGKLWVATGLEGKLYSFDGRQMVLEKEVEERQVVALLPGDPGPAFATTNAPAVYRLTAERERRGTYTSPALDAGSVARFGTLHWRGTTGEGGPHQGQVRFAFRSGVSEEPDSTWSGWTEPQAPSAEGEVSLDGVPEGRYVQWRATLQGGGGAAASPRIDAVELSYRQENLRPKITAFQALDPGEILVPAGFNPSQQVYEPAHPNKEGIFTTLEEAATEGEGRLKTLWKKGYRSFRWSADDPNGDDLAYSLQFRPIETRGEVAEAAEKGAGAGWQDAGAGGKDDAGWLTVADDLDDDYYSFDATVLPDGVYRFRLTASDAAENAPGDGQSGEELSEPVVIDHAPPKLVEAKRKGGMLRVVLEDDWNPLRAAEVSVDAGDWTPAPAADGLLDARREVLEIPVPDGAKLLLLRATDAASNVATYDLSAKIR